MRKASNKRPAKSRSKSQKTHNARPAPTDPGKRDLMGKIVSYGIGATIVGGLGLFTVNTVMASLKERDLSKIGQGKPSVVQIHDPQCPVCARLMRQTRDALSQFSNDDVNYLVANIKSEEGRLLAQKYSVPHVTLLLFDAGGRHVHTVNGVKPSASLVPIFKKLVDKTLR